MKNKRLRPSEALSRRFFRAEENVQQESEEAITSIPRLGFQIGDIGLLIAENIISELNDVTQICPVPNTASWLLGLVNMRGNLVPVFNMKELIGIEGGISRKGMLLILDQGEDSVAIPIDDLPIQHSFFPDDKLNNLPALPSAIQNFVHSGFETDGNLWFSFDHRAFFQSLANKVAV
jgi:chemotaxis signal transduction protein